jgi:RHS repeat-associated protein
MLLLLVASSPNGFCVEVGDDGEYNQPPKPRTMLLTGSVNYNIPIKVPAGRANIEPALSISYNSYAKDGLLGYGWQLSGLGSISRSTKWGLDYNGYDFNANGKELVPWSTDANGNGEYRAQINEHFTRYEFNHDTGWIVTRKNGKKYYYGIGIESREDNEYGVFAWYLCRIEDPNANYLTVYYRKYGGRPLPDKIEYTGNSTAQSDPTYKVRFHYEPRFDQSTSYDTLVPVVTDRRLMTVTVRSGDNLVRAYKIDYNDDINAPLFTSYLEAVTEYGSDAQFSATYRITGGSSLVPVKAQYTEVESYENSDFSVSSGSSVVKEITYRGSGAPVWKPLDYNGDGNTELVTVHGGWPSYEWHLWIYQLNESTFTSKPIQIISPPSNFNINDGETGPIIKDFHPADFNGDGKTDIIIYTVQKVISSKNSYSTSYKYIFKQKLCLSTGNDFEVIDVDVGRYRADSGKGDRIQFRHNYGDFDGDGRTDIYFQYDYYRSYKGSTNCWHGGRSNGWMIYLANDSGFDLISSDGDSDHWFCRHNEPYKPLTTIKNYTEGDFNGDGRTDLILHGWQGTIRKDGYDVEYFTGMGFEKAYHGTTPSYKDRIIPGDYNGDGKTDLLVTAESDNNWGGCKLFLATGNGFIQSSSSSNPSYNAHLHPADFNGDGRTDVLAVPRTKPGFFYSRWQGYKIYLSKGDEFELALETISPNFSYNPIGSWYNIITGDFDGDNLSDFLTLRFSHGVYSPGATNLFLASVDKSQNLDQNLPNLLGKVDNGRGGKHKFVYRPSSMYDNFNLDFVLPVASQTIDSDGTGNQKVINFDYFGGYFKRDTRDFLGFKRVTKTLKDGRREQTFYHQDNGLNSAKVATWKMANATIPRYYSDKPMSYYKKGKVMSRISYQAGSDTKIRQTDYDWNVDSQDQTKPSYFISLGSRKTYEYDHSNDAFLNTIVSYRYDPSKGNLLEKKVISSDPDSETITATYDYKNCADWLWRPTLESIKGSDSGAVRQVEYDFDSKGNLIFQEHYNDSADNPTIQYSSSDYDDYGNRLVAIDFKGNETKYTYDLATHSKVETATNPKGHVQTFYYHHLHGIIENHEDPNGNYARYLHDVFGRVESVEIYDPFNVLQAKTKTAYQMQSFPNFIKKSVWENTDGGAIDSYRYFDGLGRVIQTVSIGESGQRIVNRTIYDDMGRKSDNYGPYFSNDSSEAILYDIVPESPHNWTDSFDSRDRPLVVKTADEGRELTTRYNYEGLQTTSTDPDGAAKTSILDGHGRTRQIIEDPGNENIVTTYTYNAVGDLLTITDASGKDTTIGLNTLGNKISMRDPDVGDWQYRYDLNGNLEWQRDANDQEIEFIYDSLNRVTGINYLNGGAYDFNVAYTYDDPEITFCNPLGYLSRESNGRVTTDFTDYDAKGNLRSETKTISGDTMRTTVYNYDLAGKLTQTIYPDGHKVNVDYYPGSGLIKRVWGPSSEGQISYVTYQNYPATGKVHQAVFQNGIETVYDYTLYSNRLTKIRTHHNGTDYINREYIYTPAGDIESIDDADIANTRFYKYDKLHRLISEYNSTDTYNYLVPSIMNFTYDLDQPHHAVGTITTHRGASHDFSYDGNGNLVEGPDLTNLENPAIRGIVYNAENMPVQINHGTKGTTSLDYDSTQKRAKKTSAAGTTYYINKLFEITPHGVVKYIFAGNNRVAAIKPQGTFYIHADHLNSATIITDKDGQVVDQADYLPFGGRRENSIALIDYRFTDQEWDKSTGLYNYDARLYDPVIGRFVSADSIVPSFLNPQSLNRYNYCYNNPLAYIDPSGHTPGAQELEDAENEGKDWWAGTPWESGGSGTEASDVVLKWWGTEPGNRIGSTEYVGKFSFELNKLIGQGIPVHELPIEDLDDLFIGIRDYYKNTNTEIVAGILMGAGALVERANIAPKSGPSAFRQGTFADEAKDWGGNYVKGKQWAADNPLTTKDYAKKYGLPAENTGKPDWVVKGRVEGNYKTRPAPASHNNPANTGGGTEIIPDNQNNVKLDWFHMPD